MKKRTVYVVHEQYRTNNSGAKKPKFDLAPATAFGELVFLLPPDTKPTDPERVIAQLHRKLFDYDPTCDRLLLVGNPCLIGWATAIAAHYGNGRVTLLQWEAQKRAYVEVSSYLRIGLPS